MTELGLQVFTSVPACYGQPLLKNRFCNDVALPPHQPSPQQYWHIQRTESPSLLLSHYGGNMQTDSPMLAMERWIGSVIGFCRNGELRENAAQPAFVYF